MKTKLSPAHEKSMKAIISLLIVLLAFSIFLLFKSYSDNIISSNQFQPFMILTVFGLGLLVGLLFLVNGPSKTVKAYTHSKKAHSGKKKKR